MATTFNDALQLFNVGTSSTTNINEGNVVIPEGSETLSDLIKLNYDFKETPFNSESKSYNIYIWNNNTDGEIRFYTKDAKNNNDFNKDFLSGNYSEPRLNFNTKIGKNGKLYYWHNFTLTNPAKLSGWYEISDNISSIESQLIFLDGLTAGLSASLILTNNNVGLLAGRVSVIEDAIVLIATDVNMIGDDVISLRRNVASIWDYMDFENNPTIKNKLAEWIEAISPYNLTQGLFDEANQLLRIQSSSALSAYRINLANNFTSTVGAVAFAGAVLGGIKYIADTQQKDNYSTELIRITDTLAKRSISSANNTLIHTGITRVSGAGGFPLTNNEFIITIQKNAVLIIGIDIEGIANILLVDQIGDQPFSVNENITINRTLLNGSGGNLTLNVASLGTLKQWTELKATYLQNKISKIDTKQRRKAGVIGYNDVNTNHFTKVDTSYTDYNGTSSEVITYKTLEINPNYKSPTCIQADSATNSDTANVAVKLQTPRTIANVNFDGSANINISYNDLTNKPTTFTTNIGIGTTAHANYKLDVFGDVNIPTGSTYKINGVSIPTSLPVNQLWDYIGTETSTKGKYTMDKVGIGGFASDAYDLKLENTMTAKNYCISGSDIFKPIEKTILPARLDMTGVPLDVNKIYEKFNTTNFAIIDNLVDLPPSYSFNITGYDPQNLYNPSAERRLKGKMSASYDDRNGVHKLVSTDTSITYNTAVLSYKVGDKITFRNTADPSLDYFLFSGFKYFMKTYLYKRPSNLLFDANVNDGNTTIVFEWESNEYTAYNVYPKVYDRRTSPNKEYPFSTTMSLIVEANFNYYLLRLFYEGGVSGSTLIVVGTFYGDDYNDFNKAYGAGQTFKLLSGATAVASDYLPKTYTPPQLVPATLGQLGGVKPRRGMAVDATTGDTDIIPLSSDLITNMNTSHFTNNTSTNKIDISSSYVAPNATKLATQRTIAGVNFDGTGNIDIPYSGLTGKPSLFDGVYSSLSGKPSLFDGVYSSLSGKPSLFDGVYSSLSGKPNLFSGSYVDLSNKLTAGNGLTISTATPPVITPNFTAGTGIAINTAVNPITIGVSGLTTALIPDLATSKITSGTFADSFIPSLATSKITSGTFADSFIPSLATSKITSGTFADSFIPSLATSKITSGTFADSFIPSLATSKITSGTFADSFIPSLAIAKISGLQGALDAKQATLTAGTNISIVGTTISASATFAPTSANMIGIFNPNDFVNNVGTSKIDLSNNTSNYVARINSELTTANTALGVRVDNTSNYVLRLDGNTSNYVARINSQLTTAFGTLQPIISSTAGQLIIGNGDGITTTSTGLTWTSGTSLLTATNLAVSTQATITQLLTTGQSADMFILRNNATNSLTFQQIFNVVNDNKWILKQKSNNVDYNIFNFRNGKICVGTSANPAYMLDVVGDVNVTGGFLVNGTAYKPANAVLADTATTATSLATSRNIAGVAFNGTADIAIDYFALYNKPITVPPTTTNLLMASGYTLSVPGYTAIGTTSIATNILQVGAGGRLRISNGTTDYTLLGTIDTDGATNTSIIISGTTRSTNAGNIQYLATASGGSHIFYTASATTRMTISSSGVNVNDNFAVVGRVGIATAPHATYKLDVLGDINISGAFRVNGSALANSAWSYNSVDATKLYYNGGNVGIGTTNPTQKLDICGTNPTIRLLDTNTDGNAIIMFRELSDLYGMDIAYIGNTDNKMYIRSYNNSATAVNNITIDRATGNVGIATTTPQSACKLHVLGNAMVENTLLFNNNYRGGGADYACNKIALFSGGSPTTGVYGFGVASYTLEYFAGGSGNGIHKWYYGGNGGTDYGSVGMTLNTNSLTVGYAVIAGGYILSGDAVYARNSYDTRMYSNSTGMYLSMGDIGNTNYLTIGAYGGVSEINSQSSRSIYFRCSGGLLWIFSAGGTSLQANNSYYWGIASDQRIKENIKKANLQTCYENVKNINLYRFNFINGYKKATQHDKTQLGFVAQQVKQHFPKSVSREKTRIEDKREVPDLSILNADQVNYTLFGAVKQLIKVVEKQSKRIKKLEEMLGIIDDDEVENDADEPYERIVCDEVDIDTIEPSEPTGV